MTQLPAIGAPATRALAAIGVTTLEQAAAFEERDLLRLHGVGPRAIEILRAALATHGWTFGPAVSPEHPARRWARTWERAWPAADVEAIAVLYAPGAPYRSHPHRDPEVGGARAYVTRTFAEESDIECRFGDPVIDGDRAAVEWWASWVEDGRPITLSGTTVLRFDAAGLVTDHVDYWAESAGRVPPFPGWGRA